MSDNNILIVDDEKNNRNSIMRLFEEFEINFFEAENGKQGLDQVKMRPRIDLILLDIKMPVMDGYEFLNHYADLKKEFNSTICVMTAHNDSDTRRKAIYMGADDFISKPLDPVELETRVTSLLRISRYQQDLKTFNRSLEDLVAERTRQLQVTLDKLKASEKQNAKAYREMISRISKLSNFTDNTRRPNSQKIGLLAAAIGWLCGLSNSEAESLSLSSQVYDIGMLALPEAIRSSEFSELSEESRRTFLEYPMLGARLFQDSDTLLLKQAYNICAFHRENFDGSGIPEGLSGTSIPIESRIFSAAYLLAELIEQHPTSLFSQVLELLSANRGNVLDPEIVEKLIQSEDSLIATLNEIK